MGKIRIKTLGDEDKEKKQKAKDEARREGKKAREVSVETAEKPETAAEIPTKTTERKTKATPSIKQHQHSRRYLQNRTFIDKTKHYDITEAIELLKKMKLSSFDETVEVHVNTTDKGLKGSVSYPHSTGKTTRIIVADEKVLKEVEAGKINFDVLIAHPSLMPKLARLAKILGPKGLMPNPKNGTVSDKPEEVAKKMAGSFTFKTEPNFPLVHTLIGKISYPNKNLEENFLALVKAIGQTKIVSVFIKTTMSPSVKIQLKEEAL